MIGTAHTSTQQNVAFQRRVAGFTIALFAIKIVAWSLTHSVAILTDALEYTINVVASLIGLYSLHLSAIPRDSNHPYGHGKVEFVSAAVEGVLMLVSSIFMIFQGVDNLLHPHLLHRLDFGLALVGLTAVGNFMVGTMAVKRGERHKSLALVAEGRHMRSDTYGTIGIFVGLAILYFTGFLWIDSAVTFVFSVMIAISGYKVLRASMAGIMDEADEQLLGEVVQYLNSQRRANWMDIHKLRIIKYGSILHLDCHLTIPWYFNILQGHDEVEALENMVRDNYGEQVELFVHTDGCIPPMSCAICSKTDCTVRQAACEKNIDWTVHNVSYNSRHSVKVS
ncbi:MAG: cation transporter [Chitinophagia bacterium]|nr:cation transporter [Chitinophagia bacterium]